MRCAAHKKTWADVAVYNVQGSQMFARQCVSQDKPTHWYSMPLLISFKDNFRMKGADGRVLLVDNPEHLGEIVESTRKDWADPWLNWFKQLKRKEDGGWRSTRHHKNTHLVHELLWKRNEIALCKK